VWLYVTFVIRFSIKIVRFNLKCLLEPFVLYVFMSSQTLFISRVPPCVLPLLTCLRRVFGAGCSPFSEPTTHRMAPTPGHLRDFPRAFRPPATLTESRPARTICMISREPPLVMPLNPIGANSAKRKFEAPLSVAIIMR